LPVAFVILSNELAVILSEAKDLAVVVQNPTLLLTGRTASLQRRTGA
jgi:hypothetical protein